MTLKISIAKSSLLLILFSKNLLAGQSFISASSSQDDANGVVNSLTIGHQFRDVYLVTLEGSRSLQKDEDLTSDNEIDSKSAAFTFSHIASDYFQYQLSGRRTVDSEYLSNNQQGINIGFNLNRIWKSIYSTRFNLNYQRTNYNYLRDFPNRTIDEELSQGQSSAGFSHEFSYQWEVSYLYSHYQYSTSPFDYLDTYGVALSRIPQFESLLYDFYAQSHLLSIYYYLNNWIFSVYMQDAITYIEHNRERSSGLGFNYLWDTVEIGLDYSKIEFQTDDLNQMTLTLIYYF